MKSLFIILLSIFYLAQAQEFAQVFFRHGQRLPTNYLTFPNEHLDLSSIKDLDKGELTSAGIQQSYTLGQNLHEQYSKLVGSVYKSANLVVYSGVDNRTVASASALLAGLFPPTPAQTWNAELPWLPIPVFAEEVLDDVSFGILDNCPYYVKNTFNVSSDRAIFDKYSKLAEKLSNQTGVPIYDLDRLQKVIDGIISRRFLTNLLPLPKWADDPVFVLKMKAVLDQIHSQYIQLLMPQSGAWHFDWLVGNFDDFVNNRTKHKMVLYSGHDTNMMTLGLYLNISTVNETLQPTASYLAFELSRSPFYDDFLVKVFLQNKLNGTRKRLDIGWCEEPCKYSEFRQLRQRTTLRDFDALCKQLDVRQDLYGGLASAFIILSVLLLVALIAALVSCQNWRKRYERLANEEQQPLLTHRQVVVEQ
ncbi:Prostatic acid phosphatase [Aphelenchoides bicaudatus]|nr:Prostatic acid phosphatase [Aphelenchoides bicaudatus]